MPPCERLGLEASLGKASRRGCGQCGQSLNRASQSWQQRCLAIVHIVHSPQLPADPAQLGMQTGPQAAKRGSNSAR